MTNHADTIRREYEKCDEKIAAIRRDYCGCDGHWPGKPCPIHDRDASVKLGEDKP